MIRKESAVLLPCSRIPTCLPRAGTHKKFNVDRTMPDGSTNKKLFEFDVLPLGRLSFRNQLVPGGAFWIPPQKNRNPTGARFTFGGSLWKSMTLFHGGDDYVGILRPNSALNAHKAPTRGPF